MTSDTGIIEGAQVYPPKARAQEATKVMKK